MRLSLIRNLQKVKASFERIAQGFTEDASFLSGRGTEEVAPGVQKVQAPSPVKCPVNQHQAAASQSDGADIERHLRRGLETC